MINTSTHWHTALCGLAPKSANISICQQLLCPGLVLGIRSALMKDGQNSTMLMEEQKGLKTMLFGGLFDA